MLTGTRSHDLIRSKGDKAMKKFASLFALVLALLHVGVARAQAPSLSIR